MPPWCSCSICSLTCSMAGSTRGLPTAKDVRGVFPMREQSDKTMSAVRAAPSGVTRLAAVRSQSLWRNFWRRFCRHRLALVGMTALLVLTLSTLLGPLVYHQRINDIDFAVSLQGPSLAHPLGTDDLGQDLLARILYGGRVSMAVGLVAMLI